MRIHLPVSVFALLTIISAPVLADNPASSTVTSPNGRITLAFSLTDDGRLAYKIDVDGKPLVLESTLGFKLKDAGDLESGFKITTEARRSHDDTWKPVYGEREVVPDKYNELTVSLEDSADPPRKMDLVFRVFDEGVAWRYVFPKQPGSKSFTIASEETRFRFAADHTAWPVYAAQGKYEKKRLSEVKPNCERPLVLETADGPCVAIAEAALVDFARMRLRPSGEPLTLASHLAGPAIVKTPYQTPWRVVMIADSPAKLLEQNYILENLNPPCAIADTSWIKPGKVIREVTLSTEGGKRCVDYAVKMGIKYVHYDAGWYGNEYDAKSDATTITRDPKRGDPKTPLDLHEVIRYAKERGIGITVYVNRRALEKQLDEILPLYRKWGIKGVKYGFVRVGDQKWTTWMHEAVRKAAENQLMVDIHDEYRPTGFSRTYPNLMTVEGIRGNEEMPPAEHNVITALTRMLCGAGDYTVCWYCDRIKTTRAHQLGCCVVFYSPWLFVHWYDRPEQYQGEPELEFFKYVPTVWDETKVVLADIGNYVVIARRSGDTWYIGGLNAGRRRTLKVPLDFLDKNKRYTAHVYRDGAPDGSDSKKVAMTQNRAAAGDVLEIDAASNGGFAARIVPE